MGKKSTIILFAVITMLASSLCFGMVSVYETGRWSDSWPKELEPYRRQANTRKIAAGNRENVYEIRFENREEFEKLWPIILKLKDKKAPLRLRSIKRPIKEGSLSNSEKPVVRVFSHVYPAWPSRRPGGRELRPAPPWPDSIKSPTGELPEYVARSEDGNAWIPVEKEKPRDFMWSWVEEGKPRGPMYRARTEIELVVDGTIIDLNRILLPPDTPIIDRRFQEKVAGHNKPVEKMRGFSMQNHPYPRSDGKPDPDSIRREEIMAEFRSMGKEVVPAIAHVLKDSDVQMRRNATLVLIELAGDWTGKPTVDIRIAIPSLINAAEDPDHHVRAWAAHALAEIGPDAKQAVPILTKMLKDPKEGPRNTSAMALGQIGAAAKTALPALREALKDPKEDVRRISKAAIAQIEMACAQNDQETK